MTKAMPTTIKIGERRIGAGEPCFVIAEAGVNHNGSLDLARRLVDAAVHAGADAVKFQTFRADKLISPAAPKAAYQVETTGTGESQLEMVRKLELPPQAFRELKSCCAQRGILFLSTPFDEESADLLDELGMAAFKVPSGEITNLPLLEHLARKRKPLIVSTGMCDLEEVRTAVECLRRAGARELALLHCVSSYPASAASINLRAMETLRETFAVPVGFSDHALGVDIPLAAVALGACIVEKHLTLDCQLPGPDHRASLEPGDFTAMVEGIRAVEAALGDGIKRPAPEERNTAEVARRSLVAACGIPAGTVLRAEHIAILRPGTGLPPAARPQVIGKRAARDIPAGALLTWEMLA
jgi:N,N'-diacetyllegionaminate synthase